MPTCEMAIMMSPWSVTSGLGRAADGDGAGVLHIGGEARAEDAGAGRNDDLAGGVVVADDVVGEDRVEVDAEAVAERVEVGELGVVAVVGEEQQDAAGLDPGLDGVAAGLVHIVRVGVLDGDVGRGDDVDLGVGQRGGGGRGG